MNSHAHFCVKVHVLFLPLHLSIVLLCHIQRRSKSCSILVLHLFCMFVFAYWFEFIREESFALKLNYGPHHVTMSGLDDGHELCRMSPFNAKSSAESNNPSSVIRWTGAYERACEGKSFDFSLMWNQLSRLFDLFHISFLSPWVERLILSKNSNICTCMCKSWVGRPAGRQHSLCASLLLWQMPGLRLCNQFHCMCQLVEVDRNREDVFLILSGAAYFSVCLSHLFHSCIQTLSDFSICFGDILQMWMTFAHVFSF